MFVELRLQIKHFTETGTYERYWYVVPYDDIWVCIQYTSTYALLVEGKYRY